MLVKRFSLVLLVAIAAAAIGCQQNKTDVPTVSPATLRDVPALRLNFRFENDVPPPEIKNTVANEEINNLIQLDFDTARPEETLVKTIPSSDKKRFAAVYQKLGDTPATYRLDMYSAEGKLLKKVTPNGLAVHYPDTIVWSPDNNSVAFVGMIRLGQAAAAPTPTPDAPTPPDLGNDNTGDNTSTPADANTDANSNTNSAPTVEPPAQVLTFRTEQIYICNSEGGELKPLTQNEGFIYFYFVWSPDSSALVSLVATWKEWEFMKAQAEQRGEVFVPMGRPRLVEKTGRIRLLDDNITAVRPVWSPDSAKVALGFDKEVRIYDAIGDSPTQSAIPLRNQFRIAAQKFDEELKKKELAEAGNTNSNTANKSANVNSAANEPVNLTPTDVATLPDENTLVSFTPIIQLEWTEDRMLYLQTGYVKEFKDATQNTRSYLRWHRLLFSPQAVKLN